MSKSSEEDIRQKELLERTEPKAENLPQERRDPSNEECIVCRRKTAPTPNYDPNMAILNGLSSKTCFYKYQTGSLGRYTVEFHEHPESRELVIINNWFDNHAEPDYEILGVYQPIACELAKLNAPFMVGGRHFRMNQDD